MDDLLEVWQKPAASEVYMIAGWHQWADAGEISSGLPQYLVDHLGAVKIGEIKPGTFYLFQIPGTHHLLRPSVKLNDGHRQEMESRSNEFFYHSGDETKGLVVFLGEEPHQGEERYAQAFFDAVEALGVRRVAAVGGVYAAMPYDKDREISCVYSLPSMKDELSHYAVRFSDYEGGATIGTYLAHVAEARGIEFLALYGMVPAYDFLRPTLGLQQDRTENDQMRIDQDYKAWYDLMRRLDHMYGLGMNLTDLRVQSYELTSSMRDRIQELDRTLPQLQVSEYMETIASEFVEVPFEPLADVWEDALRDLLGTDDE